MITRTLGSTPYNSAVAIFAFLMAWPLWALAATCFLVTISYTWPTQRRVQQRRIDQAVRYVAAHPELVNR